MTREQLTCRMGTTAAVLSGGGSHTQGPNKCMKREVPTGASLAHPPGENVFCIPVQVCLYFIDPPTHSRVVARCPPTHPREPVSTLSRPRCGSAAHCGYYPGMGRAVHGLTRDAKPMFCQKHMFGGSEWDHCSSAHRAGGGGGMRSPGLAKNAEKCGKNAENAILLEWCLPLETPMFRLVLHDRVLKAWTV